MYTHPSILDNSSVPSDSSSDDSELFAEANSDADKLRSGLAFLLKNNHLSANDLTNLLMDSFQTLFSDNSYLSMVDKSGNNLFLMTVIHGGYREFVCVNMLYKRLCNEKQYFEFLINRNNNCLTALDLAIMSNNKEIYKILFTEYSQNSCLAATNVLTTALNCDNPYFLIYLVEKKPDLKEEIAHNRNILSLPFQLRNMAIIETLISLKIIDVNYTDELGNTALHWAVKNNDQSNIIKLLLRGANDDLLNLVGERPIDCASSIEIEALLQPVTKIQILLGLSSNPKSLISSPNYVVFFVFIILLYVNKITSLVLYPIFELVYIFVLFVSF